MDDATCYEVGLLMPALTMRGRYLMREYWSDSDLFLKLTADQREVYVGLWMLADDDGWLPRDIPAIAAALYRYEDRAPRETAVRATLARLGVLTKVVSHRCGCLYLPSVSMYPRAGKKSTEHAANHQRHLKGVKPIQTDSNASPYVTGSIPSSPVVAREGADARDDTSEFRQRVPRPGAITGDDAL